MIRRPAKLPELMTHLAVAVCGCLLLLAARPLAAECSERHADRIPSPEGSQIRIVAESAGAPVEQRAIEEAIAMWTGTCAESLPSFGTWGNIVMRVRFHAGPNDIEGCGDGCACTISNTLAAAGGGDYLASSITHLFERHRDGGGYCRAHRGETLAHEIGHVLGFRHPEDPYSPSCRGKIMSFSPRRSVRPADCEALTTSRTLSGRATAASRTAETEGALKPLQDP